MHLTLFFTHKGSLKTWARVGMFDREVALYRKYLEKGVNVSFITYGRKDHKLFAERLSGIEILCNQLNLPTSLYTKLIPLLHAKTLRQTDIIKSNQTPGALTALRSAKLYNKPMLARCGYMHSVNTAHEQGEDSENAKQARKDERKLFTNATRVEVTTRLMKEHILSQLPVEDEKVSVIPNYVDISVFKARQIQKNIDLIFIGRLNPEKNLFALLDALQGLNLKTVIIGKGPQEEELKRYSQQLALDIEWTGNLSNTQLPDYLNRSKLFILPSLYEGHPKTLIEAMAIGMPVIGANSPGIKEIITHMKNGWLCETDPNSIRNAITELLASKAILNHLGQNANKFALSNYSLDNIAEQEFTLLNTIIKP